MGTCVTAIDFDLETWLVRKLAFLASTPTSEIDPDAPIYEVGLDSLETVGLLTEIELRVDRRVPLADVIYEGRTIRDLATLLRQSDWTPITRSLVALRHEGDKPPVFCVHPLGGNVACFVPLANLLGSDRPFYGLQSRGLFDGEGLLTSCEDMAVRYIEEIKSVQPRGPYVLLGACFGGMVAYEMARQLDAGGDQVGFLGLIDPRTPPTLLKSAEAEIAALEAGQTQTLSERAEVLRALKAEAAEKHDDGMETIFIPDDPILRRVMATNGQARDVYDPKPYSGHATFFWANKTAGQMGFDHDPRVCWTTLCEGGLALYELPVNHYEILHKRYVRHLANKLRDCLSA